MVRIRTFRPTEEVLLLVNGRELFEPPSMRRVTDSSRLVRIDEQTTIPILWLIAERKFGPWDPKTHKPYWIDRDYTNESFDNVGLVEVSSESRQRTSKYGVPAGTREYHRLYLQEHREKNRLYQKERYRREREILASRQNQASLGPTATGVPGERSELTTKFEEALKALGVDPDASKSVEKG